jgi:hypothetical protein
LQQNPGEYIFPDPEQDAALITEVQQGLAARSGIPIAEILREQEERLTDGIIPTPRKTQPAGELDGRQPSDLSENGSRPDPAQPKPRNTKETPSRPTLDEDHMKLLTYLMEHPDSPVNVVYKEVGVRAAKIRQIREELTVAGLLADLEVRTGRITAGRPTKFLIPTFSAFALLKKDPPSGRGGVIHRAIQHAVSEGALARGFTTKVEYPLQSGAIVDVHLENGRQRIAVEIAVISKPSRELAHMRQCLNAGYDKVFTVFADPQLLEKTNESLAEFSTEERAKIQLIPVSKLAGIG